MQRWAALVVLSGCAHTTTDPPPQDPPPGDLFDDDLVLVVPQATGLELIASDGSTALSRGWSDLVGDCDACGGEGASADGDGLLVSFTTARGQGMPGAFARLDANAQLDLRVDGLGFPHDVVRDPADGSLLVLETTLGAITWFSGDGSSDEPLRQLDADHPDWIGAAPNGAEHLVWQDRSLLLVSHRGIAAGDDPISGAITLWDLTTPDAPQRLWRFPEDGALGVPHGPVIRTLDDRLWLLWAHTEGTPEGGSVGVAVLDDPTQPPTYVADLLPPTTVAPLEFLRGIELTAQGWLLLTDSGDPQAPTGRLIRSRFPGDLAPTGAGGAAGSDQVLIELQDAEIVRGGLAYPFEGWLWRSSLPL